MKVGEFEVTDETLKSFDKSFAILEKISEALDYTDIHVDTITEYAKLSIPLIHACKAHIAETEDVIAQLVNELDDLK